MKFALCVVTVLCISTLDYGNSLTCQCDDLQKQITALRQAVEEITGRRVNHGSCPDYWKTYGGSCYLFPSSVMNFVDAEEFCEEHGAHLVHVDNTWENAFIKGHLAQINAGHTWLGLTDGISEGIWTWYGTNKAPSFTDWYQGEPNNYRDEDCAGFFSGVSYRWADLQCSSLLRFVCEI